MHILSPLIKRMAEELNDAVIYYDLALTTKDEQPGTARTYYEIGQQELDHCEKLHTAAINYINRLKQNTEGISEATAAVWVYANADILEDYDKIKYKYLKLNI